MMDSKPLSRSMRASDYCHSRSISAEAPKYSSSGLPHAPPPADETNTSKPQQRKPMLIRPRIWAAFKKQQKEVAPTLARRYRERNAQWSADDISTMLAGNASAKAARPGPKSGGATRRQRERMTLGRFMIDTSLRHPEGEAMLPIMKAVGKACTAVSRLVRQAQSRRMMTPQDPNTLLEQTDIHGRRAQELQALANNIFLKGLCQPHVMSCVASADEAVVRMCSAVVGEEDDEEEWHGGEYAAVFIPLDRSANLDAGLQCATIFGILRTSGTALEGRLTAGPSTIILPGRRFVAAGYCLYGPPTKLVFTIGDGVVEFTLDEQGNRLDGGGHGRRGEGEASSVGIRKAIGLGDLEFILSHPSLRIPRSGKMGNAKESAQGRHLDVSQKASGGDAAESATGNPISQTQSKAAAVGSGEKYAGTLVTNIHSVLTQGGFLACPAGRQGSNEGLRLIYEGNPLAMIIEQAGGVATTGLEPIRDVRPQSVHHRIPAFFGSPDDLLPLLNQDYLQPPPTRAS